MTGRGRSVAPGPDRAGPRLVADHSEGELELASLGGITVIGESHFSLFMLVNAHI